MSLSRTTLRLITVLFLLAGILLLRKPVFGQTITAAPTRVSLVVHENHNGKSPVPLHPVSSPGPRSPMASISLHRMGHPQLASIWRLADSSVSETVTGQP
jgi:hypothetical protein